MGGGGELLVGQQKKSDSKDSRIQCMEFTAVNSLVYKDVLDFSRCALKYLEFLKGSIKD